MRVLLCLASVFSGLGQTINTSGSFDFNLAGSWAEGSAPADINAVLHPFSWVVIQGGASVYLSDTISLYSPLQLGSLSASAGAGADATTTLLLNGYDLTTSELVWARGHIVANGSATFSLQKSITGSGNAYLNTSDDKSFEGGTLSLSAPVLGAKTTVYVNGGTLWIKSGTLSANGNQVAIAANATLEWVGQSAVSSQAWIQGQGKVVVDATANVAVGADLTLQNAKTQVQGNVTVAAGKTVAVTGELVVEAGARVYRTAYDSSKLIQAQAGASVHFTAGASASAAASVQGGLVSIEQGAQAIVDAGVSVWADDVTFASQTNLTLNFATGGSFQTFNSKGAVSIDSGSSLVINGPEPTARVVLAQAASIAGKFGNIWVNGKVVTSGSASVGRRLLAGTVVYSNSTIEYQPGGNASPATKAHCLLVFLVPLALLW